MPETKTGAPCTSNPALFDSVNYGDHLDARESCLACFSRSSCRLEALGRPDATGTLGGDLFRNGVVVMAIR